MEVHAERMIRARTSESTEGSNARGAIARRREGETLEFAAPQGGARDPTRGAVRALPDAELRCERPVWVASRSPNRVPSVRFSPLA